MVRVDASVMSLSSLALQLPEIGPGNTQLGRHLPEEGNIPAPVKPGPGA